MASLTWNAGANGAVASSAGSWTPVQAPAAGDDLTFNGTSVKTCTMDLIVSITSLTVTTLYTGYVQVISSLTVGSGIWLDGA